MNATEWGTLLLALLVSGGVLYFILTQPIPTYTESGPPTLTIEGLPTAYVGETHLVHVRVTQHEGGDIFVETGEETIRLVCPSPSCEFPLSFTFDQEGTPTIRARTGFLVREIAITVKVSGAVCLDGTPEGECGTPPLRCQDARLLPNCDVCGCQGGEVCSQGSCATLPFDFSLTLGEIPSLYTTVAHPIPTRVTNEGPFPVNGLFILRAEWFDASLHPLGTQSNQFLLTDMMAGETHTLPIPILFPLEAAYLNIQWFPAGSTYDASTLLAELATLEKITVTEDHSPPAPASGLQYEREADLLTLKWTASPSGDVIEYRVHRQTLATGGFTSYTYIGSTPELIYSIPDVHEETAFLIIARDGAGNDSTPTEPLVVLAP